MTTLAKPLVMDLGLHNGDDTANYLAQGYRVVALDADPMHIEHASQRFASAIACGDLTLEHCGLTIADGEQPFYRSRRVTEWSSFDAGLAGRKDEAVDTLTVPCRHPRFLFVRYGLPHYLKVDLEGNDHCVVAALAELTKRPRYFSCELCHVGDIDLVAALGYRRFAVVDQSQYLGTNTPSGPFGDAITAPWVDADEARRQYTEGRANPLSWFDLHAQ